MMPGHRIPARHFPKQPHPRRESHAEGRRAERRAIADLQVSTAHIVTTLEGITTSLKSIDSRVDQLGSRIDEVKQDLGQRIDEVKHDLGTRIDQVDARLDKRIDQVEMRMDRSEQRLEAKIVEHAKSVNARFDSIDRRLAKIDDHLIKGGDRFERIEGRFSMVGERIDRVGERLTQTGERTAHLINGVNKRIDGHGIEIGAIQRKVYRAGLIASAIVVGSSYAVTHLEMAADVVKTVTKHISR